MISISDAMLFLSGGLVAISILLPQIGFRNSALSVKAISFFSGIETSIGVCIFIFYTLGKGDPTGSIFTGIIAGTTVGLVMFFLFRKK